MGNGYWRQRCENGDVWLARGSDRSFVIKRSLRDSWDSHGGFSRRVLPWPMRRTWAMGIGASVARTATYGRVAVLGFKYAVVRSLRDSFNKNGGYHALGGPVADEEDMGNGYWRQRCENGNVS